MRVVGTAGHVDHGKSTLVQALTGIHPDRLKEEREREMTIDLGFAWLTLPNDEEVGIVDVPGHRDFIENMLAGVGGIDAALFVVAADEGIMPQTREHLAILDLLQIRGGVVALTKIDLVDDPEWLDLVEEEFQEVVTGTVLEAARIVRVSARTGEGISTLLQALVECLAESPPRVDIGKPRLGVDRVFTIAGFGTVVTGTLSDGQLKVGEEIQVLPHARRGRIRGLQTHKRKEELAVPGSRTAVNLTGIEIDQVRRGDVITHPGDYRPTRRLDVSFRYLPEIRHPLVHNTEVKLFLGAAEIVARLRLLGSEELKPGETGWLQLELVQPVIAVRGDRYILRRPSPGETLGGGIIVDPHPHSRHRRFSAETLAALETLAQGTPDEVLLQALLALGAAPFQEVLARSNLDSEMAEKALHELIVREQVIFLEVDEIQSIFTPGLKNTLIASLSYWSLLASRVLNEIEAYHLANPLRRGIPREELKSRLKISARLFNAALRRLAAQAALVDSGTFVQLPSFSIRFSPTQQRQVDDLLKRFIASPYAPPTVKECQAQVGDELYDAMVEVGMLVPIPPDVVFRQEDYQTMLSEVQRLLEKHGAITAAQVRDHFNTSRRYVLALLEYLDKLGITVREGDYRRPGQGQAHS